MSSFITSITKRKKTPDKLVRLCLQILTESAPLDIEGDTPDPEKEVQNLCKRLSQMKAVLYGAGDKVEVEEEKTIELSNSIQSSGLMIILIEKLGVIPFEARKDTAQIFNNLMHKNIMDFASYVRQNFSMVLMMMDGYHSPDIALSCGSMLRECIRHEDLAREMLASEKIWCFFESYVHLPNFDVASDAFNTLRDLLTTMKNKSVSAEFLSSQYDTVFLKYETLLKSDNYVTRRRSLKLLAELLLDRSNFSVMIRYISDRKNLQLIMNLLRDKSPNIQFEAFHVFKVFVANPKKPLDISTILYNNKDKIMAYLNNFHLDREDPQFADEKKLLLDTLAALRRPLPSVPVATPAPAEEITSTKMAQDASNDQVVSSAEQPTPDAAPSAQEKDGVADVSSDLEETRISDA